MKKGELEDAIRRDRQQVRTELFRTIEDISNKYYGRDSKNAIIQKMLYIEGFKGNDVAQQLGMTASAVTQRCQKMMYDVVTPYFQEILRSVRIRIL